MPPEERFCTTKTQIGLLAGLRFIANFGVIGLPRRAVT
jgi:hypothetical protein